MTVEPFGRELEQITQLRKKGLIDEAIQLIRNMISDYPFDGAANVELIKLLLLSQQNDSAYEVYLLLKQLPGSHSFWEAEYLARLEIVLNRRLPELNLADLKRSSKWTLDYRIEGTDPLYIANIIDCSIVFEFDQSGRYLFTCVCPSCGGENEARVYTSFMIQKEVLCPGCLAKLVIHYEAIKQFVENNLSSLVGESVYSLDDVLKKMEMEMEDDLLIGGDLPLACKALYLNNSLIINQVLVKPLCSQRGGKR